MQAAVRPYLSAGVALVGAGAIALSPISPVVPSDMKLPSVPHVSIPVELAAAVNPIQAYLDLVGNTVENLSSLGQSVLANPAPILRQILANQFATAGDLLSAFQTAGGQLLQNFGTVVPQELKSALANLAAGNIVGVGQNLVNIIVQPVLFPVLTLLPAIQSALEKPVANLLAVTQQFTTIFALGGIGLLEPLVSTINATAQAIQNVVDAARTLNPIGAVSAIAAAPAIVVNGLLNGFGFDGGVLSSGLGLVGALLQIRNVIATAITPAAAATITATDAVTSTKTTAAKVVTLDVAPQQGATATDGQSATGKDATATDAKGDASGKATTSTSSTSDTTTGTSPDSTSTTGTATTGDTATKAGDTTDKGDSTTSKGGDATAKDSASSTAGSDTDAGSASTTKADTGTKKASHTKKAASEKAATAKADK